MAIKDSFGLDLSAKLQLGTLLQSSMGSERFHPGLKISLGDELVYFKSEPHIDSDGTVVANAEAIAAVVIHFKDGVEVRFSGYPVVIRTGTQLLEFRGAPISRRVRAA